LCYMNSRSLEIQTLFTLNQIYTVFSSQLTLHFIKTEALTLEPFT